jgi:hypothetical protein
MRYLIADEPALDRVHVSGEERASPPAVAVGPARELLRRLARHAPNQRTICPCRNRTQFVLGRLQDVSRLGELKGCSLARLHARTLKLRVHGAICHHCLQGEKEKRAPNAVETLSRRLLTWRCGAFGLAVIPPLVAVLAK